jgi:biopolymer transport protein ExbD
MAGVMSKSNNSKRIRRNVVGINVTPLLDVLLVLLIIFMMTAQMVHNDVDLNLPRVSTEKGSNVSSQDDLIISINNKQEIFINDERIDNLEIYIASLNNKFDKIILASDLNVPYQRIIEVLISLNNLGFTKIKMAYDKK